MGKKRWMRELWRKERGCEGNGGVGLKKGRGCERVWLEEGNRVGV